MSHFAGSGQIASWPLRRSIIMGNAVNTFLLGLIFSSTLTWASTDGPYFPIKMNAGEKGISKFEADWYGKCPGAASHSRRTPETDRGNG